MIRTEPPLQLLERGASELGIPLSSTQLAQFERYLTELQKWNRKINLTGTRDLSQIVVRHMLDSLAGLTVLADLPPGVSIADMGSGAGFPGLPIKIVRSDLRTTLIEPRQKRAAFLSTVCALLGLQGVTIAEDTISAKHVPARLARQFHCVVMRAVADPLKAKALAALLLIEGGRVVIWASEQQAREVGGDFVVHPYRLPGTTVKHTLLVHAEP